MAQSCEGFLGGGDLLFELDALQFQYFNFGLAGADDAFLFSPLCGEALQFELRDAEAFADASHLGIELLQHVSRCHGLMFGFALFAIETFEQGTEVFDLAAQSEDAHFFFAQGAFEILELTQDFAQFALHRQRAFRALFASGNRDVVEAFAGLGEEEGVGIFEREAAGHAGFRDDVSVAQLGQDDFKRLAEAVEHSNRALQRNNLGCGRGAVRGFIENE